MDAGKALLSPTRTYAPVLKKILENMREKVHGIIHCSGGGQTKVLHFARNMDIVKDNLFPLPPVFAMIHEESGTDFGEMYRVFNMGHRMEIYLSPEAAPEVIETSRSFGIDAKIIGHCKSSRQSSLTIRSDFGTFTYPGK